MIDKKPMFVKSVDTKKVVEVLLQVPPNGTVSYADLSKVIGRDVTKEARHVLESARRIVFAQEQTIFDAIRGEGIKRADDIAVINSLDDGFAKIRRTAKRYNRRAEHGVKDFNALPNDLKIKHNTARSMLGVVEHIMKQSQVKQFEVKVAKAADSLSLASTLEAFK